MSKIVSAIFVFILITVSLGFVYLDFNKIDDSYYSSDDNSYFYEYSLAEENYCFFVDDCSNQQQKSILPAYGVRVDLCFPEDMKDVDFSQAELYYNGERLELSIDKDFVVDVHDDGTIWLNLHTFVSAFDAVTAMYKGKVYLFYTGKYYFEKICISDFESYGFHDMKSHSDDDGLEAEIFISPKPNRGNFVIPEQIVSNDYIEIFEESYYESGLTKIKLELDKKILYDAGIRRLSYESFWLVKEGYVNSFVMREVNVHEITDPN